MIVGVIIKKYNSSNELLASCKSQKKSREELNNPVQIIQSIMKYIRK